VEVAVGRAAADQCDNFSSALLLAAGVMQGQFLHGSKHDHNVTEDLENPPTHPTSLPSPYIVPLDPTSQRHQWRLLLPIDYLLEPDTSTNPTQFIKVMLKENTNISTPRFSAFLNCFPEKWFLFFFALSSRPLKACATLRHARRVALP
jgi:hypothetical protein